MATVNLKAKQREKRGKSAVKKLRAQGEVPAIIYGEGLASTPLQVAEPDLKAALRTEAGVHALINLEIEGSGGSRTETVIAKEIQRHPTRDNYLHADFYKVAMDKKIETAVPIVLTGESPGAKMGGVLQRGLWELKIECLPTDIPEHLEVDVSPLEIGDTIKVSDLAIPEGVELLISPDEIVVHILPPTIHKEEVVAPEVVEPEVIGEAKEKEEEAKE